MISILLAAVDSRSFWADFDSEYKFTTACFTCNRVVSLLKENSSAKPELIDGSPCSQENSSNIFCSLISSIYSLLTLTYKDKIPGNACAIIGPCVPRNLTNTSGDYCYQCRALSSLAMYSEPENRTIMVQAFCRTARGPFVDFCSAIEEDAKAKFMNAIEKESAAAAICSSTGYCHRNGTKGAKKSQRKSFHHHEL